MTLPTLTDSISITLNGEPRRFLTGGSVADLVRDIGLDPAKVAVERNLEIVARSTLADVSLAEGDVLEIVHFVGGGQSDERMGDSWSVAGRKFHSRLIVGTGKYKDFEQNAAALVASGAEIITVAVRRVNVSIVRIVKCYSSGNHVDERFIRGRTTRRSGDVVLFCYHR